MHHRTNFDVTQMKCTASNRGMNLSINEVLCFVNITKGTFKGDENGDEETMHDIEGVTIHKSTESFLAQNFLEYVDGDGGR